MEMFAASLEGHTGLIEMIYRFAAASVLAGLLGINREWRNKPAGLRTHILVAVAACAFALLSLELFLESADMAEGAQSDPVRVVEAVVKGVAFLGAGVIIQSGGTVTGVTTGASIWVAGAIGLAAGIGSMRIALLCTVFGLVALIVLGWIERVAVRRPPRDGEE
ncbi:MgtC/SapB family protein [Novispirillum sp. DQ9]|uniref:MgtC/SapB family protein n=1 Tax=Novispirillum sp. DQ9 TaxID=3398612 RepID=UPI003C7BA028